MICASVWRLRFIARSLDQSKRSGNLTFPMGLFLGARGVPYIKDHRCPNTDSGCPECHIYHFILLQYHLGLFVDEPNFNREP